MSDSLPVEDTPEPVEQPGMNESFTVNLGKSPLKRENVFSTVKYS